MVLAHFIFYLGILSFVIWIYQAIVLPSIRQRLRFELFRLRDELRELAISGRLKGDGAAFHGLHHRLNVLIKAIPALDIALLYAMKDNDPELEKRAAKFQQLIEDSIPEAKAIYRRALKTLAIAFIANSILWFVCISIAAIPVAVTQGVRNPVAVTRGFWKLCAVIRERVAMRVQPAFGLNYQDLEYMPSLSTSAYGTAVVAR